MSESVRQLLFVPPMSEKEIAHIRKLFEVAQQGDRKKLEGLLGKQAPNIMNENQSLLHLAVEKNLSEIFLVLLNKNAKVDILDKDGATPLHYCARSGQSAFARMLIERGAIINPLDTQNASPLHWACQKGQLEMAKLLVSAGAPIAGKAKLDVTPLHAAVSSGHQPVTQFLLSNHGGIENKIANGSTPLHIAVKKGNLEMARLLLKYRANTNARTTGNFTSLHFACVQGSTQLVQLLLYCGVDATIRDKDGNTPAALALQNNFGNIAKYIQKATIPVFDFLDNELIVHIASFLSSESDLHAFCITSKRHYICSQPSWKSYCLRSGCQPSETAVMEGNWSTHASLVEKILEFYRLTPEQAPVALVAEIQRIGMQAQPFHISPLQAAVALIQHGTDPNTIHKSGISVIHMALLKGASELVHLLAERGADINRPKANGNTPLHDLAAMGRIKICDWVLKLGANPNIQNEHGDTAIMVAGKQDQWKSAFLISVRGGDINLPNHCGETLLHLSIEKHSNVNVVLRILDLGANINAPGLAGNAAIHYAARLGYNELLEVLLDQKADPNVINSGGSSALHEACFNNQLFCCKTLLNHQANANIQNLDGNTVYFIARLMNHQKLMTFFQERHIITVSRAKGFFMIGKNSTGER